MDRDYKQKVKTMKRDYKNYFLGKRYKCAGYRLTGALFIFLYCFITLGGMDSHHLTTSEAFRRKIEEMFFQSILLFVFPVVLWGKRWQRILALLLSFFPLANLFVLLTILLGIN